MVLARLAAVLVCTIGLLACAEPATPTAASGPHAKPGFVTDVQDGRLWVFRADSKDLADFRKHGEPARMVTRIGAGPNGMTIRSSDAKVIDDYLAAR